MLYITFFCSLRWQYKYQQAMKLSKHPITPNHRA